MRERNREWVREKDNEGGREGLRESKRKQTTGKPHILKRGRD